MVHRPTLPEVRMPRCTGLPLPTLTLMVGLKCTPTLSLAISYRLATHPSLPLPLPPLSPSPPPALQQVCEKSNRMFKSAPRALFITLEDRGRVFR